MGLFSSDNPKEKQHKGILGAFSVDVIKWEPETDREASIIAHKFQYEDFPNGSYLIVGPSQMAVFTNNLAAGSSLDDGGSGASQMSTFIGPCKIKLETGDSRFAPFRNTAHKLTGGESAFHSTVYFINTTYMNELNWGTQAPIVVVDPEEEVNVHVRAFGLFGAHIEQIDTGIAVVQARKFLQKVVGTRADFTREELVSFMRAKILEYVPNLLSQYIISRQISILKISLYYSELSRNIYEKLIPTFDDFGLTLDNFSFHNINAPEEDLAAINELKIRKRQKLLEAEGNAVQMDIESEAMARKRAREGYTYQQEHSYGVMQAAAENEGSGSAFMSGGIGLGMGFGVGGAIGSGIRTITENTISQNNLNAAQPPAGAVGQPGVRTCPECGTAVPETSKFCLNCGHPFPAHGESCPNCGHVVIPGSKFCLSCGFKLVSENPVCPNCGKELPAGSKFCLSCGTKIE